MNRVERKNHYCPVKIIKKSVLSVINIVLTISVCYRFEFPPVVRHAVPQLSEGTNYELRQTYFLTGNGSSAYA